MTKPTSTSFTVTVNGKPRSILSVVERPTGDLILKTRSNQQRHRASGIFIDSAADDPYHRLPITEAHYSVHRSAASEIVNLIKLTNRFADGTERTVVQYTAAIKSARLFTPIYTRRCSNLYNSIFDTKSTHDIFINLGEIPHVCSVIFSIFIGPNDLVFTKTLARDARTKQVRFREFSIVIIRSILPLQAHESGLFIHAASTRQNGPTTGMTELECVNYFYECRDSAKQEFLSTLRNDPSVGDKINLLADAPYLRDFKKDDPKLQAWFHSLAIRGTLPGVSGR